MQNATIDTGGTRNAIIARAMQHPIADTAQRRTGSGTNVIVTLIVMRAIIVTVRAR